MKLTSYEVNAISVVAKQRNGLPKDYLLAHCNTMGLSADALDIVRLILADDFEKFGKTLSNAKKKMKIANCYLEWVH